MAKGLSIVRLDGLSKPGTVLIEKISDAIGGIFKPYQIKRVAEAEAEANLIHAKANIEITELQERAFHRFLNEEVKKRENIESITSKAIPQLENNSTPQDVADDWIANFFDKCRIISDGEMQLLWAKVLAGEANTPGSYSKRTVNFLGSLDKQDAIIFTNLCRFSWIIGTLSPLILNLEIQSTPAMGSHSNR
jgi:hypothetical protein